MEEGKEAGKAEAVRQGAEIMKKAKKKRKQREEIF